MVISIKVDASDVRRAIRELAAEDAPFVTAYALTKTAQEIKQEEIKSMSSVFDRPTKFTLNALYVKSATKTDLTAEVYFKDGFGSIPAWRYLGPQVEGGERKHKAHELRLIRAGHMLPQEFAVPGKGVKLDAYGNMPGSLIERILSQVQAAEQLSGYSANATGKSLKRARKRKIGRYFVLRPGGAGPGNRNVAPGIYFRAGAREIVPVIMFVKSPKYQKRFPFYETARAVADRRLMVYAREGFERYVVNKRRKAA